MNPTHSTWLDLRLETRDSPLHRRGVFATAPIKEGEVVTVWAHSVLDADEATQVDGGDLHRRADSSYVWLPASGYDPAEELLNHSCDPNVWMIDEVTLAARRDIAAGEELTGDYALWELDREHVCPFECRCGSSRCRSKVTGRDWELPELRARYAGHFHPVIEARIADEEGPR